jgi:hypothetical protein
MRTLKIYRADLETENHVPLIVRAAAAAGIRGVHSAQRNRGIDGQWTLLGRPARAGAAQPVREVVWVDVVKSAAA